MNQHLHTHAQRIEALQSQLKQKQWDAFLVPHGDIHRNEYLPEAAKHRDWLCGFTGSAGDLLVRAEGKATLYADGRYHIEADEQVPLSHVQVSKLGLPGHPTLMETLKALPAQSTLALDAKTVTAQQFQQFQKQAPHLNFILLDTNPIEALKTQAGERAESPQAPWLALDASFHGRETREKLKDIREALKAGGATATVVSDAADIAWLTNTRGGDIPYNPVFLSFMWIDDERVILFASPPDDAQSQAATRALKAQGVTLQPYTEFQAFLKAQSAGHPVRVYNGSHSQAVYEWLKAGGASLQEGEDIIYTRKFVKTPEELAGMREANLRSSVAVIRTLAWLDAQVEAGQPVSEADLAATIEGFYREEGCCDLSFNTIAGIGPNTAKIHYKDHSLEKVQAAGQWVLLDSGAQYANIGTTDITRTTTLGQHGITPKHREAYTLVLKALINCTGAIFPKGTSGAQLDGICRQVLWEGGSEGHYDYGHGTGHGVGAFLNVHEGPNGISKGYTGAILPNTINSIEPGYYEAGWGGIRLENLAEVQVLENAPRPAGTPQAEWYHFTPLNWIPFASHLIEADLLERKEIAWLKTYYTGIQEKVLPRLEGKDASAAAWLKRMLAVL